MTHPTANYETVENIAEFLMSQNGSVLGYWSGKLTKAVQMEVFGHYFGKGLIVIDGGTETVTHYVKVCFGTDTAITGQMTFTGQINQGYS